MTTADRDRDTKPPTWRRVEYREPGGALLWTYDYVAETHIRQPQPPAWMLLPLDYDVRDAKLVDTP